MLIIILISPIIFFEQIHCKNVSELSPIDKRDEVLASLFNYGDPSFEYPSIIKLNKACNLKIKNGLREMMMDLLRIIVKHYQNDVVITASELMFDGPLIPDDECSKTVGPQSRAGQNQIKLMNEKRFEAKNWREFLEVAMTEATQPDTEFELPLLACYLRLWMVKTIEKYPVKDGVRKRVSDHTHYTFDSVIKYMEQQGNDRITDCKFMNLPNEMPKLRFKSIQMNLLEAINNLSRRKDRTYE